MKINRNMGNVGNGELVRSKKFKNNGPRERLVDVGVSKLTDSELISVVLCSGTSKKSVELLSEELSGILKRSSQRPELTDLLQIQGLGIAKACQVLACLELSVRFLLGGKGEAVTNPNQLVPHLAFLKAKTQEHMVCITLNGANCVISVHLLTIGLVNQTQIHPREAFVHAVEERAVGVIFAHNHPSGTLQPSMEDLTITRRLVECGKILDIPVLDHLIIAVEGWVSLKSTHPTLFALALGAI